MFTQNDWVDSSSFSLLMEVVLIFVKYIHFTSESQVASIHGMFYKFSWHPRIISPMVMVWKSMLIISSLHKGKLRPGEVHKMRQTCRVAKEGLFRGWLTHPYPVHFVKVRLTSLAANVLEPCTMNFSQMASDGTQTLEESFQPLSSSVHDPSPPPPLHSQSEWLSFPRPE